MLGKELEIPKNIKSAGILWKMNCLGNKGKFFFYWHPVSTLVGLLFLHQGVSLTFLPRIHGLAILPWVRRHLYSLQVLPHLAALVHRFFLVTHKPWVTVSAAIFHTCK